MIALNTPVMVKNDIEEYGIVVGNKRNPFGYPVVEVQFWDSNTGQHYTEWYAERDVYPQE